MVFDKSQGSFPSDFHREVWWWAIGIVPPADSLIGEVTSAFAPEVIEGCRQWHAYFLRLCSDMYGNAQAYAPASPRQYRDLLEAVASEGEYVHGPAEGRPLGPGAGAGLGSAPADPHAGHGRLVRGLEGWDSYTAKADRGKGLASLGARVGGLLDALGRTGLWHARDAGAGTASFGIDGHPLALRAMMAMEGSPGIRKTPARGHFAHCEFRQLTKSYSANHAELMRRASDDGLRVAGEVHEHLRALKVPRNIHFGIIKYKHNGVRILDYDLHGDEHPTLRINVGTCADPGSARSVGGYAEAVGRFDPGLRGYFLRHVDRCADAGHIKYAVDAGGRAETVCACAKVRVNPTPGDMWAVKALIGARKDSIDAM
ncbi:MAG: hypothetical protein FWE70_06050 [Oscillospiraceae bacterium]|nr:hypothetical protein [Oscillospiraceae bacterium]